MPWRGPPVAPPTSGGAGLVERRPALSGAADGPYGHSSYANRSPRGSFSLTTPDQAGKRRVRGRRPLGIEVTIAVRNVLATHPTRLAVGISNPNGGIPSDGQDKALSSTVYGKTDRPLRHQRPHRVHA
jgi:hypothetical protein